MNRTAFPVGFHQLHPNASMNFQMNRWYSWVGEEGMLDEMQAAASRIANYSDWKREFLALATHASNIGHPLRVAFYFRSADFFMRTGDPDRKSARQNFLSAIRSVYRLDAHQRHAIPYTDGEVQGVLPAYRFVPAQSKGTIVFFGGFDSYIEELTSGFFYLRDAGYEVVAFEGPGQGGALNDAGLHMTAEWHKPVKAVLDHFELDHVTLIGLSMGGCLVLRAAAFEPRVERVVAYDIYPDSLEVNLRQVNPLLRGLMKVLLDLRAAGVVNVMAKRVARKNAIADWGIDEGMHVTGSTSPYEYFQKIRLFHTNDVSALVEQDVLLLAGSEDHLLPVTDFYEQIKMLRNARSLTARLFTKSDSAQNHCQVGNYGLAFRTIVNWLDGMQAQTPTEVPDTVLPPIEVETGRLRGCDAHESLVAGPMSPGTGIVTAMSFSLLGLFAGCAWVPPTVANDLSLEFVELGHYRFHVRTVGDTQLPPVIVVHGGPGGDSKYLYPMEGLSRNHRVIFYDQRGTGLSPRVNKESLTLQSSLDDLHSIVSHYGGGGQVKLIGHSWGAMLVVAYLGKHPDKVSHAVVVEPGILNPVSAVAFVRRFKASQSLWDVLPLVKYILHTPFVSNRDGHERFDYVMTRLMNRAEPGGPYQCKGETMPANAFEREGYAAFDNMLKPVLARPESFSQNLTNGVAAYQGNLLMLSSECSFIGYQYQQEFHISSMPTQTMHLQAVGMGHNMLTLNPAWSVARVNDSFGSAPASGP